MISLVLAFVSRLGSEITPQPELKEMAKADMQQLMTLVRHTGVSITYIDKVSSVLTENKLCLITFLWFLLTFADHAIHFIPLAFSDLVAISLLVP
jgi:hypothetical protein